MSNFHLLPDGNLWKLTAEDGEQALSEFESREIAVEEATAIVKEREGSLKIHLADGTIGEERTFPGTGGTRRTPRRHPGWPCPGVPLQTSPPGENPGKSPRCF